MKLLASLLAITALSACSTATVYDFVAANTDPDCSRITNAEERARCKKAANVDYETYERERQKAKKL